MNYLRRSIEKELQKAAKAFPALIVTGPRRAGKTTLLKHLLPRASYHLLEDPDMIARIRNDPRGFMNEIRLPVILDEIQNVPELFNYIRSRIDSDPERCGQWYITGSQEAPMMKGVSESMAGRAAIFHLMPLSISESDKVDLFAGGFPEVLSKPSSAQIWFRSYIQTYLERDIRAISAIGDLATFRRFISVLASRNGQILNKTDLAAPLGVSVPTIAAWLSILEITGQIAIIPPYFENFGKRLIKSPKVYFVDSGLLCHLLGIRSKIELRTSPFLGSIFEGFVAVEIMKAQLNAGRARDLYYFRDQQGLEVDFLVLKGNKRIALVEVKASSTVMPDDARSLVRLTSSMSGYNVSSYVIHRPLKSPAMTFLAPGIKALGLPDFIDSI